jgi:hypothetical protein
MRTVKLVDSWLSSLRVRENGETGPLGPLLYPEMYLIHRGYNQFWDRMPNKGLCEPEGYLLMIDPCYDHCLNLARAATRLLYGVFDRRCQAGVHGHHGRTTDPSRVWTLLGEPLAADVGACPCQAGLKRDPAVLSSRHATFPPCSCAARELPSLPINLSEVGWAYKLAESTAQRLAFEEDSDTEEVPTLANLGCAADDKAVGHKARMREKQRNRGAGTRTSFFSPGAGLPRPPLVVGSAMAHSTIRPRGLLLHSTVRPGLGTVDRLGGATSFPHLSAASAEGSAALNAAAPNPLAAAAPSVPGNGTSSPIPRRRALFMSPSAGLPSASPAVAFHSEPLLSSSSGPVFALSRLSTGCGFGGNGTDPAVSLGQSAHSDGGVPGVGVDVADALSFFPAPLQLTPVLPLPAPHDTATPATDAEVAARQPVGSGRLSYRDALRESSGPAQGTRGLRAIDASAASALSNRPVADGAHSAVKARPVRSGRVGDVENAQMNTHGNNL